MRTQLSKVVMTCCLFPLTHRNGKPEERRDPDHRRQPQPSSPTSPPKLAWYPSPARAPGTPTPALHHGSWPGLRAHRLGLPAASVHWRNSGPRGRSRTRCPFLSQERDPQLPTQLIMKTDSQQKTARTENTGLDRGPKIARGAAVASSVLSKGNRRSWAP